jgi:hypothetical protein
MTTQETEPGSGKRPRLLVPGYLFALIVVEFTTGWLLVRVGQSLALPVLVIVGDAVVLLMLGVWLVDVLGKTHGELGKVQRGLFFGTVVIVLLATYWTVEWVLPARVASEDARLTQVAEHVMTLPVLANTCSYKTSLIGSVPLMGTPARVCRYVDMVVLSEEGHDAGLIYLSRGTLQESGICGRHLYGPWWEWAAAQPDCPFGLAFFPSG